jgi:hypothetical protein
VPDPDPHPGDEQSCEPCDPKDRKQGPIREAGGTTGAGNSSPAQSNRTGGPTSGTGSGDPYDPNPTQPRTLQNKNNKPNEP